ncbi:hypothetical protein HanIR_Chr12g0584111 [Helianthus annuus]|nr:hypothetical protein HanIR_Chr12g0584111 [Helianthus annuus]
MFRQHVSSTCCYISSRYEDRRVAHQRAGSRLERECRERVVFVLVLVLSCNETLLDLIYEPVNC